MSVELPACWCYQCGGACAEFFAAGLHLDPHPLTARQAAWTWVYQQIPDVERDPLWLRTLATELQAVAWMIEHPGRLRGRR